jgi:hypothetical protein
MAKKVIKKVIELKEKEPAQQTKWEVMVPCGVDECKVIEITADGWIDDGELTIFWKGASYEEGEEVAVFKEWIYAIKKPLV